MILLGIKKISLYWEDSTLLVDFLLLPLLVDPGIVAGSDGSVAGADGSEAGADRSEAGANSLSRETGQKCRVCI